MADLPQPPGPEGPPAEGYRRQALEATLAEALRDARLTGRPAPSATPDGRPAGGRDQPAGGRDQADPIQAPRPAPSLIGSMRSVSPPAGSTGSAQSPIGGGSTISRLVPPGNSPRPTGGQIGGAPSGVITGGLSGLGSSPIGRLGSDGLEPDDVQAVIEMRRPARRTSPPSSQPSDRKASSSVPPIATPEATAPSPQRASEAAARDESARRSSALSFIAPWGPECDDILPGVTARRPSRGLGGPKKRPATREAQPPSAGKSKKR